jgi:hypothetical protein
MDASTEFSLESSRPGAQDNIQPRGLEYLPSVVERLLRSDASDASEAALTSQRTHELQAQPPTNEPDARTIAAQINAKRQQAPISQPSRPVQAQPEEIQIHIGRIEVLAVPQVASRPAATPARKGLNLDDYLSRRNGRSG